MVADYPKGTAYERSKQEAERVALAGAGGASRSSWSTRAAVYGPGPAAQRLGRGATSSARCCASRLPVMTPGGFGVVFSDGVGRGQLLAALKGRPGERYILCDGHISLAELARMAVDAAAGAACRRRSPRRWRARSRSAARRSSRIIRRPPLLPRGQLHFFLWNAAPCSDKAQRELGWRPTDLRDGMRRTLEAHGMLDD